MRLRAAVAVASAWVALVAGCGTAPNNSDKQEDPEQPALSRAQTSPPGDEVTVLAGEAPGALAIGVSQALYDQAPVVVLAGEDDPASQQAAADAAVTLGVPLLLTPADPAAGEPLTGELARLAPAAVSTYGEAAAAWASQSGSGVPVVPDGGGPATPTPAPSLPPVAPPEPLAALTVLARDGDDPLAATTTARAAGARVLVTGASDPRTDQRLIEALAERPPSHTLALGDGFGPADLLAERLAVAATGVQLPGGGQVLFPGRRFVALYGHPGDPVLGVLGEQPVGEAVTRAQRLAAEYDSLVDEPVIPAFEIITTVASASAGPTKDYSRRAPIDKLRPWIDAAREAGAYVVLDLQPGRTDFLTQAKEYEELLTEPHVGLALDPEWRLAPDQKHLEQIGSVDAAEVNGVVEWLADLTAKHRLPQKLLILHQFTIRMIGDRNSIHTGRDELAVLIHVDGFGTPAEKSNTWNALQFDPPPDVWWGWKNFYDEDQPTFTPQRTVAVSPSPVFISYQ
jgi:hypothetical protein